MKIESNTFAEACYNMNNIAELEQALTEGPDTADMQTWGLTESQWVEQVETALSALREESAA